MKESPLVALIPIRVAQTRCLLLLLAAVLGLCANCRADSIQVYKDFSVGFVSGGLTIRSDSTGVSVALDFPSDIGTAGERPISVPALPAGAEVISATFSVINFTGTETAPGSYRGRNQVQLNYLTAHALGPDGLADYGVPCLPPSCAPAIATVSVGWTAALGNNCVDFNDARNLGTNCFRTSNNFNLLSLGKPASYYADGFFVGATNFPDGYTCCDSPSIDQVLYPGLNSIGQWDIVPATELEMQEAVDIEYITTPEPKTGWLVGACFLCSLLIAARKAHA